MHTTRHNRARGNSGLFALVALCALLAAVAMIAPHFLHLASSAGAHAVAGAGTGLAMFGVTLQLPEPVGADKLEAARKPTPGSYRVFEDVIMDTVNYPMAGVVGNTLDFFAAANADRTMSTLDLAGLLPQSHYFHARRLFVDFLWQPSLTTVATTAGRLNDIEAIMQTGRAALRYNDPNAQQTRSLIPLTFIGGSGGADGRLAGTETAPAMIQQARNEAHGGFPFNQVIRGNEKFGFTLVMGALTPISADVLIRVSLLGWRYIPVG